MSDLYENYGLEMEAEAPGAEPNLMPKKPVVVKRGSMLGKVVCLLLGFVLGAGGVVGGVVGTGYYVATQPVDKTLETVNGITGGNIDFSQYISEDYAKLTVMELVGKIGEVANKFTNGQGALKDLAEISPYVNTALKPLVDKVGELGLTIDQEDMMATPVGELPGYFMEAAKDMTLIDILTTAGMQTTPLLESVCYKENGAPVTVRDIMDGGVDSLLQSIPLEALLIAESGVVDPDADMMIMTLAYGNANRYTVNAENKVDMNAVTFTKEGEKFYDIDGKEVTVQKDGGTLTAELDGETVYLQAGEGDRYLAYKEAECATQVFYKKIMVGDLMGGNATEIFNTIELGSLFNVSPLDEDADAITLALAYGEKGTHYEIVEGKLVWLENENGEKYRPRTIGSLLTGNITDLISDIKLATLFKLEEPKANYEEGEKPDAITMALAFGEEGTHYDFDGAGNLVWLDNGEGGKHAPRTLGTLLEGERSELIFDMKLGTLLDISPLEKTDGNGLMVAIAYGEEGKHYKLEGDTIVWQDKDGDPATDETYAPRTLDDLVNNSDTLFNEIYLGTVLGIDPLDNYDEDTTNDASELMLALAYGYPLTHYTVSADGTEITYIQEPKTIQALTEGNAFDEIRLCTVLNADIYAKPGDEGYDEMTHAIAFGYEGVDYIVQPDRSVTDLAGDPYDYPTVADMSNMSTMLDDLRLCTVLGVQIGDDSVDAMTAALAFGYEGIHYEFDGEGNLVWNTDDDGKSYSYRTVSDMSNMGDIINELRIETALGVTHDSPTFLLALAYGSEGSDPDVDGYELNRDADGNAIGFKNKWHYNTIADLSDPDNNIINTLKLKDLIDVSTLQDDLLLKHLSDVSVGDMPTAIGKLTFKQVYPEQIYNSRYAYYATEGAEPLILRYDSNTEMYYTDKSYAEGEEKEWFTGNEDDIVLEFKYEYWNVIENDVPGAKVNENGGYIARDKLYYHDTCKYYHYKDGDTVYQVHLTLTGQWKYLLTTDADNEAGAGVSHDYALTEFASLVTNMTKNMTNAKLRDLSADGIISLSTETLNTPLVTSLNVPLLNISFTYEPEGIENPTFGDLTVTQLMEYAAKIVKFMNDLTPTTP